METPFTKLITPFDLEDGPFSGIAQITLWMDRERVVAIPSREDPEQDVFARSSSGTAFYIGENTVLSARHVVFPADARATLELGIAIESEPIAMRLLGAEEISGVMVAPVPFFFDNAAPDALTQPPETVQLVGANAERVSRTKDIAIITELDSDLGITANISEDRTVFGLDVYLDVEQAMLFLPPEEWHLETAGFPAIVEGNPIPTESLDVFLRAFNMAGAEYPSGPIGVLSEDRRFLELAKPAVVGPGQSGGPVWGASPEEGAPFRVKAVISNGKPDPVDPSILTGLAELITFDAFEAITQAMNQAGDTLPDGVSHRITGTLGRDFIVGSPFADVLRGLGSTDRADQLAGGLGDDVYEFSHFYSDTGIREASVADGANPGFDALFFPELNRSDIRLSRAGDQNLYVSFVDPSLGGSELTVTIGDHFAGRPVEEIRLADGVISLTAGLQLVGTEFADNFGGTGFDDTLIGLGSNDGLSGFGGDDTLIGGDGPDILQGGTGSDIYILESGFGDVIVDSEGDRDRVFLDGLNFDDVRLIRPDVSGAGGISLQIFEKSTGIPAEENAARINNQFSETGQVEVLVFANGQELDLTGGLPFTGSDRRDNMRGTEFDDEFFAGDGRDFIDAGEGNDLIVGEGGNDVLSGGVGNDIYVFRPGDGEDTIVEAEVSGQDGSGSEDTIFLDEFNASQFEIDDFFFFYVIQLGADAIRVNTPGGVGNPIESIVFSDGTRVDLKLPAALENTIPEGVDDILEGISGDETLSVSIDDLLANDLDADPDTVLEIVGVEQGTGGTASLQGDSLVFVPVLTFLGLATFVYLLSDGVATVPVEVMFEVQPAVPTDEDDTLVGTEGQDSIDALGGDDLVLPLAGEDTLEGGAGTDTVSFAPLADPTFTAGAATFGVFVDLRQQGGEQNTGAGSKVLTGFENLEGSQFGDLLSGNHDANTLTGLDGADVLRGLAGDDLLEGGEGFDALEGGEGADTLFGGTGGNGEGDIATYFSATGPLVFDLSLDFSEAGNQSSDAVKEDVIGDDIEGFAGASNHSNTFIAGNGTNFFLGGAVADTFVGGTGTDQILGLAGDDVMYGGDGVDALIGEGGNDLMFGGAGGDVFFFDAVNEGNDTIADFELGTDLVFFTGRRLSGPGDLTAVSVNVGGDAGIEDARISYLIDGFASSVTVLDTDVDALLPLILF